VAKPDGPQWIRWPYWHSIADFDHKIPKRDPDGPAVAFFHAQPVEGNEGKKPHMISADPNIFTSPKTGRDYAASIKAEINRTDNSRKYSLEHVQEYSGLKEMADFISNSIDFMEQRGVDEVKATPEDIGTTLETDDLVKNLYEKRPEFPKSFPTLSRAQFVAETLVNRRDSGIPLTPRRRKQ
jgi:hypothetical protein